MPSVLRPAQHQPGVERAGHRADRVLVEGDPLGDVEVAHDQRPADDVGVAAGVLGGGVHHHVGAEGERLLQVGRGEGVVDDEQRARVVGHRGQRRDVADVEQRVGGRLEPHQLGLPGPHGGRHRLDVVDRRRRVLDPPRLLDLVEEPEGAAVGVVRQHHVVARQAGRPHQRVLGGESGGEREPALALLQGRQVALQRGARRVGRAAVLVATAQPTHAVLLVRRRREDRRDHRPRRRVGLVAGVDRPGLEPGLVTVLLLTHHSDTSARGTP